MILLRTTLQVEVVETDIQQGAVMVCNHFTFGLQKCIVNIRNIKTDGCTSLYWYLTNIAILVQTELQL